MTVKSVLLLVVLAALAVFAALNWGAIMTPTTLSVGFTQVQGPLGLILLGFVAALAAIFLAFVVYLQGSVLMETRRHTRELAAQRELADRAEASRFTELTARIDRMEREIVTAIERSERSVAAYIGELDERIRGAEATAPAPPALPDARGEPGP